MVTANDGTIFLLETRWPKKEKVGNERAWTVKLLEKLAESFHCDRCLIRSLRFAALWLAQMMAYEPELTLFAVRYHCDAFPLDL